MHPSDDRELLRRFAAGDRGAFSVFYRRHRGRLFAFLVAQTGRPEDADEVLQLLFVTFFKRLDSFLAADNPEAYLFQCARHHCMDYLSRRQRSAESQILDHDVDRRFWNATSPPTDEDGESFQACLRSLPADQREVIAMRFARGLTFREIAAELKLSQKTVEARYQYGLEKLRRRMLNET